MDTPIPPTTPRLRARRAPLIDLAVTIVPDCERTPEWSALWRRLLRPLPAVPDAENAQGVTHDAPSTRG
jgi:hypothetical protein